MKIGIMDRAWPAAAKQWRNKQGGRGYARTTTRRSALCSHVELRGSNTGPILLKLLAPGA